MFNPALEAVLMAQHILYQRFPERVYIYMTRMTWLTLRNRAMLPKLYEGLISQFFGIDVMVDDELPQGIWEIRYKGTVLASGALEVEVDNESSLPQKSDEGRTTIENPSDSD